MSVTRQEPVPAGMVHAQDAEGVFGELLITTGKIPLGGAGGAAAGAAG